MSVEELLKDPDQLEALLLDPEASASDLKAVSESPALVLRLVQIILVNQKQIDHIVSNQFAQDERIVSLEEDLAEKDLVIDDLSVKLMETQQYQRRNTVILTRIPFEKEEDIEDKVINLIQDSEVLPPGYTFSKYDIDHVHRNKYNAPSSVTLRFTRGFIKDIIFSKKPQFKKANKDTGVNIHHAMCQGMIDIKTEIESDDQVKWADYRGHRKYFAVKLHDVEPLYRNIRNLADLHKAIASAPPPQHPQLVGQRVQQLMLNKPWLDPNKPGLDIPGVEDKLIQQLQNLPNTPVQPASPTQHTTPDAT